MPLQHSVEEVVLNNGMRGLLIDVPGSSVVTYEIHFLAGNYFGSSVDKQQTAHIMEHMAFGGTKAFPTQEKFSQEFTKNGAYHNATTWEYEMSYYADCAHMEWDRILDLQKTAITEPLFTEDILKAEKGNVREELTGQANNRRRIIWQNTIKAMGDGMLIDVEKIKTINAVSLADIQTHHEKTHTLENMRFSFAGDLKQHRDQIITQLESWKLSQGARLDVPKQVLHSAPAVSMYRKDMPSVIFSIIMVVNRKFTQEEQFSLQALNHILTGTHHSRILGKARTQGLCYGMGSSVGVDIDGMSRFELGGQVSAENAQALFELISEELAKAVDGDISESELNDAKQFSLGTQQMNGQTVNDVNGWYASQYFEDGTIDLMENAPAEIKAIKLKDMQTLLKEILETGEWTIGVIGAMRKPEVETLYDIIAKRMHKGVK
jgi:predicted Zn-dependent peptidase